MHGFCSQGQPEAVRRRFLLDFYGPRYRKWPNGRRVAKATRTKYRKNHTEHRATAAAGRGTTATGPELKVSGSYFQTRRADLRFK